MKVYGIVKKYKNNVVSLMGCSCTCACSYSKGNPTSDMTSNYLSSGAYAQREVFMKKGKIFGIIKKINKNVFACGCICTGTNDDDQYEDGQKSDEGNYCR